MLVDVIVKRNVDTTLHPKNTLKKTLITVKDQLTGQTRHKSVNPNQQAIYHIA